MFDEKKSEYFTPAHGFCDSFTQKPLIDFKNVKLTVPIGKQIDNALEMWL